MSEVVHATQARIDDYGTAPRQRVARALATGTDAVFYHHDSPHATHQWHAHARTVDGGELFVRVDSGIRHHGENDPEMKVALMFRRHPGERARPVAPARCVTRDGPELAARVGEAVRDASDDSVRRCEDCGDVMAVRHGRATGTPYYGCLNFPNCTNTAATRHAPECPDCGAAMVVRERERDGNQFWGCMAYPDCKRTIDRPD